MKKKSCRRLSKTWMQKVDECLSLFSVFFNRTKVYILFHRFTFFKWFHGVNTVQRDMPKSQLSFKRNFCYCCFVWLIFISVHLTITTNMIKHNRDLHGWNNKNKIITIYYSAALSYLATLIRHIELAFSSHIYDDMVVEISCIYKNWK